MPTMRTAQPPALLPRIAGMLLLAACCAGAVRAQGQLPVPEYQLKAAYIFNFAVFAEWPPEALPSGSPLQLCAFGGNLLLDALQTLADKTVNGRKLAVRALAGSGAGAARTCHLLVLDRGDRERWPQLHRDLGGASVLTIADDKQIAAAGAMLALFKEDQRIVFDADLGAIRAAHLALSSKLLRLARSAQ
jgi:hypothetical protein